MTRRQRVLSSAAALCLGSGLLQAAVGPPAASYLRFFEVERKSTGDHPPLNGAAGVAVSADGRNVYATGELDDSLVVFDRDSASGALTLLETEQNAPDGFAGLQPLWRLKGAHGVAVSPDGAQVYVTSKVGDSLTVYDRDPATGALTFVQAKHDSVGGVNGLDGAEGIAVSPDGAHIYVAGRNDNAIAVFAHDTATGGLTFVEMDRDGFAGVAGVAGAKGVAISPDGAHVYSAGSLDNAVTVFARDAQSGKLAFIEVEQEGVNGVIGLTRARALTVSPDGLNVYVASFNDNAVAVFRRDPGTGSLTFFELQKNGISGVTGLTGARGVAVSPDGSYVYAVGNVDDALVVFNRNPETGVLTFVQLLEDSVDGINGLNGADAVAVSPDGTHVYVTGLVDDGLAVFSRDPATGSLTYVERLRDGIGDIDGLNRPYAVAVSPDNRNVYTAAYVDDAVGVFRVRGCGDGVLDPGEQCDDGNLQDGDCCSSTCTFEAATTLCRPAAGPCDVAEFCTGSSGSCPIDQFQPATLECRGAIGPCDQAEFCTGHDSACPADAMKPATVVCRAAAGPCDAADTCTGSDPACPADRKSTGVCRPAAGGCDVAETCDGVSNDCPADALEPAGFECRPAAGVCDVAERCSGTTAACPADQKSTAVCRPSAGDCDVAERCDGVANDCPADAFEPASAVCRAAAGACDVVEHCSGQTATCPPDAVKTAGTVCRAATGPCDAAETCDGQTVACPADALKPAGAPCGVDDDPCALATFCTGASDDCPTAAPRLGLAAVLCAFDRSLDKGACDGQPMPPAVERLFVKARALVVQADGAKPARKRALLRQAGALLGKASRSVTRAVSRKHLPLSTACGTATKATLADALGRLEAIPK